MSLTNPHYVKTNSKIDEPTFSLESETLSSFSKYANFLADQDDLEDIEPETPLSQLLIMAPNLLDFDVDAFILEGKTALEFNPLDDFSDDATIIDPDTELKNIIVSHLDRETAELHSNTSKHLDESTLEETVNKVTDIIHAEAQEDRQDETSDGSYITAPTSSQSSLKDHSMTSIDSEFEHELTPDQTPTQATYESLDIDLENLGGNPEEQELSNPLNTPTNTNDKTMAESTSKHTDNVNAKYQEPKLSNVNDNSFQESVNETKDPAKGLINEPIEVKIEEPAEGLINEPIEVKIEEPAEGLINEPIEVKIEEPAEVSIKKHVPEIDHETASIGTTSKELNSAKPLLKHSENVNTKINKSTAIEVFPSGPKIETQVAQETLTLTDEVSIKEEKKASQGELISSELPPHNVAIVQIPKSSTVAPDPALSGPAIEPFNLTIDTDIGIDVLRNKLRTNQENKRKRATELANLINI